MVGTWVNDGDDVITILSLKQNHSVVYITLATNMPITVNNKYSVLTSTKTNGTWSLSGNKLSVKTNEMTIPTQLSPGLFLPVTMEAQTITYTVDGEVMFPTSNKMFEDEGVTSFSKL